MKYNNIKDEDIDDFFLYFGITLNGTTSIPVWDPGISGDILFPEQLDGELDKKYQIKQERGYNITITEHELKHLLNVLKTKGFFHDEDYITRIKESNAILDNPELKKLYDQYKTMLFMHINTDDNNL